MVSIDIEHRFSRRLRAGAAGLLAAAALIGMATPAPAAAQGLLGRIKRVVEKVEETSSEAEQVVNSTERVLGTRGSRDMGQTQPSMPVDQGWNDNAQMGAGYASMGDGSASGGGGGSLVLFSRFDFLGNSVTITEDAPSLHILDINFGDKSYSLIANGPWELCKDSRFRGECRVFEGRVANLGDFRGVASSARYVGAPASGSDDFGMGGPGGGFAAPAGRLILSDRRRLEGRIVELTGDTPSLHGPAYRIGDLAYSLEATGRWELCKDTNYRGDCVVYEGRHDNLGRLGGTFSSARYLGPEQ